MIQYHPDAQTEFDVILNSRIRDVGICIGFALMRNQRIDTGQEPLAVHERVGPGAHMSDLFKVAHGYGLFSYVEYVYDVVAADVRVVALAAHYRGSAIALPTAGTAIQRGHARSR
jgi:hypothetical protein